MTKSANLQGKFRASAMVRKLSGGVPVSDNALMHYRIGFFKYRRVNHLPSKDDKVGQITVRLFQNGFIPDSETENFKKWKASNYFNSTSLSAVDVCSYNNFFAVFPEKVAGIETPTSSLEFPVTIKGKRADIDRIFSFLDHPKDAARKDDDFDLELEAEALEIELLLLKY